MDGACIYLVKNVKNVFENCLCLISISDCHVKNLLVGLMSEYWYLNIGM